jgi:hypothetical protein
VVAIPLYFLVNIKLALKRNCLFKKSFFIKYSYYYKEFKDQYYYFEILRVYIKMFFSFLAVLPGIDIETKLMLLLMMFAVYYLMILKVKPYKLRDLNQLDRILGMVFILSIFGCLILLQIDAMLNEGSMNPMAFH